MKSEFGKFHWSILLNTYAVMEYTHLETDTHIHTTWAHLHTHTDAHTYLYVPNLQQLLLIVEKEVIFIPAYFIRPQKC